MKESILDLTKIIRSKRSQCRHTKTNTKRNGTVRCVDCGDEYPCRSSCTHIDCAEERIKLGHTTEWPANLPFTVRVIDTDGIHILFDNSDETDDDFDIESVL